MQSSTEKVKKTTPGPFVKQHFKLKHKLITIITKSVTYSLLKNKTK